MGKKIKVTAIITGDIINSRKVAPRQWLTPLKKILLSQGKTPDNWEIYRGDSFQLEVSDPSEALSMAIRIKAFVKCVKGIDIRMAIGIGQKKYEGERITESNGDAFVRSGEKLEALKKEKQNLAIKTPWQDFDREMNLAIRFALIVMDNWTPATSQLVKALIDNPDLTQTQLAQKLKVTQSAISGRLKRSYYSEIMELESLFSDKTKILIDQK